MTENEIVAQSFVFLQAGFDTVSSTLTFVAHTLATKPELQEKCAKEIQRELGDKDTVKLELRSLSLKIFAKIFFTNFNNKFT